MDIILFWSQWSHGLRHELSSLDRTLIVGSNPTQGIDVCICLLCAVMCVGRGLATGSSPFQGVLPNVYRIKELKAAKVYQGAVEP
jgi:hypothetical protein